MTLPGIDISYAQASTPTLTGLVFVIPRATYRNYVDSRWVQHSTNVRKAGKKLGAYHFLYLSPSVENQVAAFLATAQGADFLMLDVEGEANSDAGWAMARTFVAEVQAKGLRIGLYASRSTFRDIGQDFDWVACWGCLPGAGAEFHQYGATTIDGHKIDGDRFMGDAAAFAKLIGATTGGIAGGIDVPGFPHSVSEPASVGTVTVPAGTQITQMVDGANVKMPAGAAPDRPCYGVDHINPDTGAVYSHGYEFDMVLGGIRQSFYVAKGLTGVVFKPAIGGDTQHTVTLAVDGTTKATVTV